MAKYKIVAESWDEILSKPGERLNYRRHRRGDVVEIPDSEVARLLAAQAIEPARGARASGKASPRSTATKKPDQAPVTVNADGADDTEDADAADSDDAEGQDANDADGGEVPRPKRTAPVEAWVEYAVSKGMARDYAAALDRDALIAELS